MLARARFLISNLSLFLTSPGISAFFFCCFGFLSPPEFRGLEKTSSVVVFATPKCFLNRSEIAQLQKITYTILFFSTLFLLRELHFWVELELNALAHKHLLNLTKSPFLFVRRKNFSRNRFSLKTICGRAITSLSCGFFAFLFLLFAVFFFLGWKYFTA